MSIVERFWPPVAAVAASLVWWYSGMTFPKDSSGLLGASATLAAVFAGFMGVSQGLILSLKDTKEYIVLKRIGFHKPLLNYLKEGITASVLFSIVSVGCFFVVQNQDGLVEKCSQTIWVAASVYSFSTYLRITSLMFKLLRQI